MKWNFIAKSALYLAAVLVVVNNPSEVKAFGLGSSNSILETSSIEDMTNFLETVAESKDIYSLSLDLNAMKEKVEVTEDGVKIAKNETFELKDNDDCDYKNILNHLAIVTCESNVNIRSTATTEDAENIVGKAYNNTAVVIEDVVECEDGLWYFIQSGNAEGYIRGDYLVTGKEARTLAEEIFEKKGTVEAESLRLREEASLEAAVLTGLLKDTVCIIEEAAENGFVKVAVEEEVGYVAEEYLNIQYDFEWALTLEEYEVKLQEEEAARILKQALAEADEVKALMKEAQRLYFAYLENKDYTPAKNTAAQYIAYAEKVAGIGEYYGVEELVTYGKTEASNGNTYVANATNKIAQQVAAQQQAAAQRPAAPQPQRPAAPAQKPAPQAPVVSGNVAAIRQALAAEALKWPGKCNYVLGGTNLSVGGAVDCSGFTQAIYKRVAGITINRTSAAQSTMGRRIDLSAVQPGDLVFYYNGNKIGHVAIYVGNGKIVHAKNPSAGIGVDNMYYKAPAWAITLF